MRLLTLSAKEFTVSGTGVRWHWRLVNPAGALVADFPVRLDQASWEYQALTDLYRWLCAHPDEEAEKILGKVGEWLTGTILGAVATALAKARPCAVRVWQEGAPLDVAGLPLELALVDGKPLAAQNVSFVMAGSGPPQRPAAAGSPLRVLGLFSLPDGAQSLNLRKERFELERLGSLLSASGRDITLETRQYGTTRDKLKEALEEGDGWDVVHLSGHGRGGTFVMERPDGSPDRVAGDALVELLDPLRDRVRLVTLSACESAERAGRRHLAVLRDGSTPGGHRDAGPAGDAGGSALAPKLASHLNCAVLGMRYPVAEAFAAAFTQQLYTLMLEKGQSLPQARAWAAAEVMKPPAIPERPALSLVTPAIYGATGLTLNLKAPDRAGPRKFGHKETKLAGVPGRPGNFVGRSGPMTRVAQVLAPQSGQSAVVIEGMAGIGKTALALETVYVQSGNFPLVIWHAFTSGADGLDGLTQALGEKIDGLDPSPMHGTEAQARALAAELRAFFGGERALVILDSADTQLTDSGNWRNERLELLVSAMTGQQGWSRVIMTTRRRLAGPAAVRLEPFGAPEAALLASEYPGLKALFDGDAPPLNAGSARSLAMAVIGATRGHPALLAMAAERSADPLLLSRLTIIARNIWAASETDLEAAYLAILSAWQSA